MRLWKATASRSLRSMYSRILLFTKSLIEKLGGNVNRFQNIRKIVSTENKREQNRFALAVIVLTDFINSDTFEIRPSKQGGLEVVAVNPAMGIELLIGSNF